MQRRIFIVSVIMLTFGFGSRAFGPQHSASASGLSIARRPATAIANPNQIASSAQPPFDLQTDEGKIRFLQFLQSVHPELIDANIFFHRNILAVLDEALQVHERNGDASGPLWVDSSIYLSAQYSSVPILYSNTALQKLKERLEQDLRQVPFHTSHSLGLVQDITGLRYSTHPFDQKQFRRQMMRILRLAPLLYDSQGLPVPLESTQNAIQALTVNGVEEMYHDRWNLHLRAKLEAELSRQPDITITSVLASFDREFLQKDIVIVTTPLANSDQSVEIRELSIESVPALVAVYRSTFAKDCSILSVPYFPLHKNAQVYFIRKGADPDSQPDGYAFVVQVLLDGQVKPYVVTINGPTLTQNDISATMTLIARAYGVDQLLTPNFKNKSTEGLVNNEASERGMNGPNPLPVFVSMPKDWDGFSDGDSNYTNYYSRSALRNAALVSPQDLGLKHVVLSSAPSPKPSRYRVSGDLDQKSLKERALFAANLSSGLNNEGLRKRILDTLGVDETQFDAAAGLLVSQSDVSGKAFRAAQKTIDFSLRDLRRFQPAKRFYSLIAVNEQNKLSDDPVWEQEVQQAQVRMERELLNSTPARFSANIQPYLRAKSRIPSKLQTDSSALIRRAIDEHSIDVKNIDLLVPYLTHCENLNLIQWMARELASRSDGAPWIAKVVLESVIPDANYEDGIKDKLLPLVASARSLLLNLFLSDDPRAHDDALARYALTTRPSLAKFLSLKALTWTQDRIRNKFQPDVLAMLALTLPNDPRTVPFLRDAISGSAPDATENVSAESLLRLYNAVQSQPPLQSTNLSERIAVTTAGWLVSTDSYNPTLLRSVIRNHQQSRLALEMRLSWSTHSSTKLAVKYLEQDSLEHDVDFDPATAMSLIISCLTVRPRSDLDEDSMQFLIHRARQLMVENSQLITYVERSLRRETIQWDASRDLTRIIEELQSSIDDKASAGHLAKSSGSCDEQVGR